MRGDVNHREGTKSFCGYSEFHYVRMILYGQYGHQLEYIMQTCMEDVGNSRKTMYKHSFIPHGFLGN